MNPASQPGAGAGRPDRPRFRQDLLAELVDEHGARFIDVMDPDSGNLFRFYESEYSLACGMDGERDVMGIVKWAQDELGMTPSHQEVRTVIATLTDLGFIDTGAAQARPAPDLAPGVVVGPQAKLPPAANLELGVPGGAAARGQPVSRSPDLALGAPGAARRGEAEPTIVDDVPLGAPGRGQARITPPPATSVPPSEVSIDLADHIAVRPADVQEAVRASKVMAAVDVPQDLLDAIEDKPTSRAPQPGFDRPPELLAPPELRGDAKPEWNDAWNDTRSDTRPDSRDARATPMEPRVGKPPLTRQPSTLKPPVELPRPPAPVEQAAPAPGPARLSATLVVLLILVALGGAAFLLWKYVLDKPSAGITTPSEPPAVPVKPAPPAPPPPPPEPTAKVAMEVPEPEDVKPSRAGVIETILADKTAVKPGDVVVKLVGDKPIEAELSGLGRDQKRLQDQIDAYTKKREAAQANGNKAAETAAQAEIDTRQKTLVAKQTQLAQKTVELDKFLIHAPSSGTFAPEVKLGQKVAADDVLATIQREAVPSATFKLTDTKPFSMNGSVDLAVGKGELRVTCTITALQPDRIKVVCPIDPALADGTDVTLKMPVPAPEPTPPAPSPSGTAAPGSGAPAPAPPVPVTPPAK